MFDKLFVILEKKISKSLMHKTKLTCSSCVFRNLQYKLARFIAKVKMTKNNFTFLIVDSTKTVFYS